MQLAFFIFLYLTSKQSAMELRMLVRGHESIEGPSLTIDGFYCAPTICAFITMKKSIA